MPELVKAVPGMFDEIHRDQLHAMNPRLPPERWRRLFVPGWESAEDHVGYALRERDRFVGFAAYLFSSQQLGGEERCVCNLSSWVVDPSFRGQAMRLVMPLLKRKDVIVTNLTPIPSVYEIFVGLGFRELESHVRVHWPALTRRTAQACVCFDGEIRTDQLSASDATVLRSHRGITPAALVETPHGRCFVLYTIVHRRGVRSARLHHVSPADGLARGLRALQWAVFRRHGALFVEYDRRLATGAPPPFIDRAHSTKRLFRSAGAPPAAVSNAYSEAVLLNI